MNRAIIAAVAATAFLSTNVFAASAKFAATYGTGYAITSVAEINDATEDTVVFDSHSGFTLAKIRVPQDKELLVGLSAEVGLNTDTSIKGKDGGAARSLAWGEGAVALFACRSEMEWNSDNCRMAAPGPVILSGRFQVLDATLGGVIESCTDGDADGTINITEDCIMSDEEIGLFLSTLAAQHFNFVLPNMDQGDYDIVAVFTTTAMALVDIDESTLSDDPAIINASASSYADAFIGKYMLTVQTVRATKDGIISMDIEEF